MNVGVCVCVCVCVCVYIYMEATIVLSWGTLQQYQLCKV